LIGSGDAASATVSVVKRRCIFVIPPPCGRWRAQIVHHIVVIYSRVRVARQHGRADGTLNVRLHSWWGCTRAAGLDERERRAVSHVPR